MKERYQWFFGEIRKSWIRYKGWFIGCGIIFFVTIMAAIGIDHF